MLDLKPWQHCHNFIAYESCHRSLEQDRNYSTDDAFFSNQKDYDVCSAMYDVCAIKLLAIHGKMIIKQINVCIYT